MDKTIAQQIQELQHMNVPDLQEKFNEVYGYRTIMNNPQALRKRLAYRLQELHYGGLTEEEHAVLNKIAAGAGLPGSSDRASIMMPGTILTRLWKGKVHEATIMKDGNYEYGGRIFHSLSRIAYEISGTKWNGKVFFGVK